MATLLYVRKENCLYRACPSTDCNKKVIDRQNGMYRCEKCNQEYPNFKYRFLLSVSSYSIYDWCFFVTLAADIEEYCHFRHHACKSSKTHMNNLTSHPLHYLSGSQANLADFGGNQWVTCFQETAEVLLGHSADILGHLRDTVR